MTTRILAVDDEPSWQTFIEENLGKILNVEVDAGPETNQEIQAACTRIIVQRRRTLLKRLEICSNNLSLLEIQQSQGQKDLSISNQINDIKQEIVEIMLELKGKDGLLLLVHQLCSPD